MKNNLLTVVFLILGTLVYAQKPTIAISTAAGKMTNVDPAALKHITIKALGHDNKEHSYTGVLLSDILIKGGIVLGAPGKKDNVSGTILVKAKDNYKASFAVAEIDSLYSKKTIIVADKQDGKELSAEDAPFQIIVPDEKIHARWIRQIVSIEQINGK